MKSKQQSISAYQLYYQTSLGREKLESDKQKTLTDLEAFRKYCTDVE